MPKTKAKAIIYTRISSDKQDGAGVDRQRRACEDICAKRGWDVAEVVTENNTGASRHSRGVRTEWARVLDAIESGSVNALVAWDLDRLTRRPREWEDLIDKADAGLLVVDRSGEKDFETPAGRQHGRNDAAAAARYADEISAKVKAAKDDAASQGAPAGGARAFGYKQDGKTIVPAEAALIRSAAKAFLRGATMTSIAREWNAKGIRTPRKGATWSVPSVRVVLKNPRYAGLRVHRGSVIGEGNWKPLFDRDTHERIVALVNDPERRHKNPPRRGLLTRLVICGKCDSVMRRDGTSYRCRPSVERPDRCGHNLIQADDLDALIVGRVLEMFDKAKIPDMENPDTGTTGDELTEIEARLAELAEAWAAGEITRLEWTAARAPLTRKHEEAVAAIASVTRSNIAADFSTPGSLRKAWPKLGVEKRHAVVAAVVDRIVIDPSTGRGFDSGRVRTEWKA